MPVSVHRKDYAMLINQVITFLISYISYIPLTYVVLETFTIIFVIIVGTYWEKPFAQLVLLTLGKSGEETTLGKQDIMTFFFAWWTVLSLIVELIKKVIKAQFASTLLTKSILGILFCLHLVAWVKLRSTMVFLLYSISVLCLLIYGFLSRLSKGIKTL
jgi:hypothetical protein